MISIATIGTSWITEAFAAAVVQTEGIALAGVYSRDPDRAEQFRSQLDAPTSWSDYEAVLRSPHVDAVYIASPNALHFEQALAALDAGKHVLVEKPATVSAEQFRALIDVAHDRGVVLMEAMRSAHDPGTQLLHRLVGELGPVRLASLSYCQRSSRYDQVLAGKRVNIFDPAFGGGALLDIGIYCVSMMVDLFGVPESVSGGQVLLRSGADGAGSAVCQYPDKVVNLVYSKITQSSTPCVVEGELGTLTFSSVAAPRKFEIRYLDGAVQTETIEASGENMAYQVAHFVSLVDGRDCKSDWLRTQGSLEVVDLLRDSDATAV